MKIGIMGGSFDPIHSGHVLVAEHAAEEAGLDEVWFIPSHAAPHKEHKPGASNEDRWRMVELAIAGNPRFRAVDWELKQGGVSYSIETARMLVTAYPDDEFFWLIGADMVQYLPHWHQIEQLCELIGFIGFARPGTSLDLSELAPTIRKRVRIVPVPSFEVSSTDIRSRIGSGRSVRYLLPEAVWHYVKERRLYES
jgi:nicotinate-nucleotide adenylyltransferase